MSILEAYYILSIVFGFMITSMYIVMTMPKEVDLSFAIIYEIISMHIIAMLVWPISLLIMIITMFKDDEY